MKKIVTIILCSALVVISGCDNYDFAQEQFRKEVTLPRRGTPSHADMCA